MRLLGAAALALMLSSCASKLEVWDQDSNPIVGVPFRSTELFIKKGFYNRHSTAGDQCTPTPFVKEVPLAVGKQYYANVNPAQMAKTGLVLKLNDAGALSEVSLNTEPSGAETIKAAGELLGSTLPFIVAPKVARAAEEETKAGAPRAAALPACDVGEDQSRVQYEPFAKYLPR